MIEGKKVVQLVMEVSKSKKERMRFSADKKRMTNDMAKKIRDGMTDAQKKQYNELKKAIKRNYDKAVGLITKWDKFRAKPSKETLRDVLKDVIETDKLAMQADKLFGEPGSDDCDTMIAAYDYDMKTSRMGQEAYGRLHDILYDSGFYEELAKWGLPEPDIKSM